MTKISSDVGRSGVSLEKRYVLPRCETLLDLDTLLCFLADTLSSHSQFVPDPIQGTIELPQWLLQIYHEKCVRRMMFIRQLGCKAYIDFPGAIHTRFSHALGTMSLASRMVDMLQNKMAGNNAIVQNLKSNKDNIMAAGFLHDIGHGPFSHVIDFVLKRVKGQDHEELGEEIVRSAVPNEIESWGISKNTVVQLIRAKGGYRFLSQIINGPIDADKLDYLLRDAHHVGYKYSFDLDHFLRSYTVIVEEQNIAKCALGLEPSREARGTAELFVMIWKGMYDLVYYSEKSRIAEKMLEKALLLSKDDEAIKDAFDMPQYLELNDEKLLSQLGKVTHPDVKHLVAVEDTKRLYNKLSFEKELQEPDFHMTTEFLGALTKDADGLSDSLSCKLNVSLKLEPYTLICDIVTSKAPKEIPLDEKDEDGVPIQLSDRSKVVAAIKPTSVLKIYVKPDRTKAFKMDDLQHKLKELAEGPFDFVAAQ